MRGYSEAAYQLETTLKSVRCAEIIARAQLSGLSATRRKLSARLRVAVRSERAFARKQAAKRRAERERWRKMHWPRR